MEAMIEIKGLTKAFGGQTALDGITLDIEDGEIFGFLGPNGAGKTTLLSILCTLSSPDGGSAAVMGNDTAGQAGEIRRSIGAVFQDKSLDEKLTGRENLEISAALYSVPKNKRKEKIDELLSGTGLAERAGSLVNTYSMGMKRRLEIARALIHNPKILFLDEPTLGLDPKAREWVWERLLEINRNEGTTIVLATNYMEEAERLCGRVGIIDGGKMISMGTPGDLKSGLEGDVITLVVPRPAEAIEAFKGAEFIRDAKVVGGKIILIVESGERAIPRIIDMAPGKVESIDFHRATLNDVFLHYTGKELRKEDAPARGKGKGKMKGRRGGF
jgi:ABC-2 type transport system ATP-binding protein